MNVKKSRPTRERLGLLIHSIRFRLVLWFTAILAVILCSFSVFLFYTQSSNLQAEAVRELDRRITGVVENVQSSLFQGSEKISLPNGLLRDSDVLVLLTTDGHVLGSEGPVTAQEAIQIVSTGSAKFPATQRIACFLLDKPNFPELRFHPHPSAGTIWNHLSDHLWGHP